MLNKLLIKELSEKVETNSTDIQNIKSAEIYSASEVKTNKIHKNGKPIYRTVVTSAVQVYIAHGILNIDEVTDVRTMAFNANSNKWFPVPSVRPNYADYQLGIYADQTNIVCEWPAGYPVSSVTVTVAIEYTKTID